MPAHSFHSPANNVLWRILAWIGVALLLVAFIFVLWAQRWNGAWTIALFFALSLAFLLMKEHVPSLVSFLVVLTAVVNAGGWAWEWYQSFAWFDEFIHTFTSFAVVSAIASAAWARGRGGFVPGGGRAVVWAAAVGLGLGILWEILESFFLNLTFWDTIVDLVLDALGAAAAGWFVGRIAARPQGS